MPDRKTCRTCGGFIPVGAGEQCEPCEDEDRWEARVQHNHDAEQVGRG